MRALVGRIGLVGIASLIVVVGGCSKDGPAGPSEPRVSLSSGVKLADNGPTETDIANALQAELTEKSSAVAVTKFEIEGQESFGNQVDLVFGQRFHATGILSEDLFSKSFLLDGNLFATVVTEKGKSLDMYGKIMSRRYQDSWKHEVDFEGNPFADLQGATRQALAKSNDATVVQLGTDEEARLLEQWRSDGRMTTQDDIGNMIVGQWDGECTREGSQKADWVVFTSIEPGGIYREGFARTRGWGAQYEIESARQRRHTGNWSIFGGGIFDRVSNYNGGNRTIERIVSIDSASYVSEANGLRCVWKRVDLAQQAQEMQEDRERQERERVAAQKEKVAQYNRNEELLSAARKGDANRIKELAGEGVNLKKEDIGGLTALMLAAKYGHAEAVKVLLAAGADPNARSRTGATALSSAKRAKQAETERILIEAGARE